MLPKDYEEFNHLVPQSGIRMKLKAMIEKYSHGFSCGFEVSEKVHTLYPNKDYNTNSNDSIKVAEYSKTLYMSRLCRKDQCDIFQGFM